MGEVVSLYGEQDMERARLLKVMCPWLTRKERGHMAEAEKKAERWNKSLLQLLAEKECGGME